MSQALIISNKQIINDVYKANLKAYVATNVTIKQTAEDAINLLDHDPDLDLIITFASIGVEKTYDILNEYIQSKQLKLPVIVVGHYASKVASHIHIPDYFNVRDIIRECAKILEITAQEMYNTPVPDHYPIPIKLFTIQGSAICDTFYKKTHEDNSFEYIKIVGEGDKINNSLDQFVNEGITELYVPSMKRLLFINSASESILGRLIDDTIPVTEQVGAIEEGADFILNEISNNNEVSQQVSKISEACINSIKKVVHEVKDMRSLLELLLNNKSNYIYKHSIMASYVCNHIIENISWGGKGQAEKLQFVLFYHDIFLTPIFTKYPDFKSEEALLYDNKLTDREKEVILNHAKMAADMVQRFSQLPIGADAIITQHHGQTSGTGFASNFKDDISPLAKVVIIAESFVEEFFSKVSPNGKSSFSANETIILLRQRYNKSTYRKIIDALENIKI